MSNKLEYSEHYAKFKELCGMEVIDITRHLDFNLGTAVNYVLKSGYYEGLDTNKLDKAIESLVIAKAHLEDEIKFLKNTLSEITKQEMLANNQINIPDKEPKTAYFSDYIK